MRRITAMILLLLLLSLAGCAANGEIQEDTRNEPSHTPQPEISESNMNITQDTTVGDILSDPAFGDFGRLLFPVDRSAPENMTLAELSASNVYHRLCDAWLGRRCCYAIIIGKKRTSYSQTIRAGINHLRLYTCLLLTLMKGDKVVEVAEIVPNLLLFGVVSGYYEILGYGAPAY